MSGLIENVAKAIELTKTLLKAKESIQNAEVKMALGDLGMELAEVKIQAAALMEENHDLKQKVKKLSEPPEVSLRDGVYFKGESDGPYCTTCYDSNRKMIRLQEMGGVFSAIGKWRCGICKSHYGGDR